MIRRLNVLQLLTTIEIGGVGSVVSMISSNLDKKRFKNIICCLEGEGPAFKEVKDNGIELRVLGLQRRSIIYFPLFVFYIVRLFGALTRLMREEKIDILHTHFPEHHIIGAICAKLAKVPVRMATFHNNIFLAERGSWDVRAWLNKELLGLIVRKNEDRIIAVGKGVRETIIELLKISPSKITLIYNGIDVDNFTKAVDIASVRRQFNLNNESKVVTCIANFYLKKGHKVLIESATTIIKNYSNVKFLFVGSGPLKNELVELVKQLNLYNYFCFLGFRRDIPEILGISDIFVLPSLWEGLPVALLEAMAAGKPAVATNIAGNSEVVLPNQTGILVPANDSSALSEAIIHLINNPKIAQEMGRCGRMRVTREFSHYSTIQKIEELYIAEAKIKIHF